MDTKETIKEIQKDIRNLKLKAFQPDKPTATTLLDYLSWDDGNAKNNFNIYFEKELKLINEWFEIYCKEHDCTKEEALERIIEE